MVETLTDIGLGQALRMAAAGKKVLVLCKSKAEAIERCEALHEKLDGRVDRKGFCSLQVPTPHGNGLIEFAWVECSSGRRMDDFDTAAFKIADAFEAAR